MQTIYPLQEISFNQSLFDRFVDYVDVKPTTLAGYMTNIKRFATWLNDNEITAPVRQDVRNYRTYLGSTGLSPATQRQYFGSVKQFFHWLASEGLYPDVADNLKSAKVRTDNSRKESFNEDDMRNVLESIDRTTESGKRDHAMVLLSVTGGLRICEMQRADVGDIETIRGEKVLYIQGKGRDSKDAFVKLIPAVAEAIDDYLSMRIVKKSDPLFAGVGNRSKGQRLTIQSISHNIKMIFKNAGYDSSKLTAHSLRHTSHTLLFKSGADLFTVQQHARHSNPATTEIYLHCAEREKNHCEQDVYNQIYGKADSGLLDDCKNLLEKLTDEQRMAAFEYLKGLANQ